MSFKVFNKDSIISSAHPDKEPSNRLKEFVDKPYLILSRNHKFNSLREDSTNNKYNCYLNPSIRDRLVNALSVYWKYNKDKWRLI